ncbi:MAG: branched-chain amino acid ABC transporter permease [Chloroflexia bacterium]|nr:branched-chain amino acid ABC transporter permease [Chloroflexia bacterium]
MRRRWFVGLDLTSIVVWSLGLAILIVAVGGTISTLRAGQYSAEEWASFFIFGLAQGGVYALIALGYTMVYGILFMINFAHGEVFMSGPYIGYFLIRAMEGSGFLEAHPVWSLLFVSITAMAVSTLLAILLERVAYRPLRKAPRLVPLITAIGASFFLQYAFRSLFGTRIKVYPAIPWGPISGSIQVGDLRVLNLHITVIAVAVLMMAGLSAFVRWSKMGKAMRAVAEDKDTAALMGINVDRVIVTTFAIGAALAGVAGVLYALLFKQITHTTGFLPGLKAFTAAVLGGIGNPAGAMLGGFFLGIFESVGPTLFFSGWDIPSPSQLKDVIAFTMLVLILIFRPTGILGEVLSKKKA